MLANLLAVPKTPEEWAVFSYSHRDQHTQIRQAIQAQGGGNLTEYVMDPIASDEFQTFLEANQNSHNDMNGVLHLQGNDLSQLDPRDQNQLEAWIYLHFREHQAAANALHVE